MTVEQYDQFREVIRKKGYKQYNHPGTIHNESWYFYKGFAYTEDEESGERTPGYQVFFLVWDWRTYDYIPDDWGVTPLIITDSHDWSRIDLQITDQNIDVEKFEQYAHDFYFNFVIIHGL